MTQHHCPCGSGMLGKRSYNARYHTWVVACPECRDPMEPAPVVARIGDEQDRRNTEARRAIEARREQVIDREVWEC